VASGSHPDQHPRRHDVGELASIDIGPLLDGSDVPGVAARIDAACRSLGFFRVTGHGIAPDLLPRLDRLAREFFDLPDAAKQPYAMAHAGSAWRGWFPVRGELTSGIADRKEGVYVGLEHPADHPRVRDGTPLHGANLFPPGELGPAILAWLDALRPVADALMRAVAVGLGLPAGWFEQHLTADPTVLFRIFHYPALPDNEVADEWGVGEHTDYGLLTLLAQDALGGLQVRTPSGEWLEVPAEPEVLVCNIGDMLDKLTEGRYRSTPHRVRNVSGRGRLSFPYFFDPSWDAQVMPLPLDGSPPADDADRRWDGASVHAWTGRYGDYQAAKVAKVFPDLFKRVNVATPDRPVATAARALGAVRREGGG
jgi:isopenicillin N synthase-like dioxygenase